MNLHLGERVYWGAPGVIYMEGVITRLDDATQTVTVQVDRATPNASHLIGEVVPFAADGLMPLQGDTPAGVVSERGEASQSARPLSDAEKVRSAAAAAVYQKYGTTLSPGQREALIDRVAQALDDDVEMRERIIQSMNQILTREHSDRNL